VVRHLVGDTPEHKALDPAQAPVPHHHEVGTDRFGHRDEHVGRVALDIVNLCRYPRSLGVGGDTGTDVVALVTHVRDGRGDRHGIDVLCAHHRAGDGANHVHDMQCRSTHLSNGEGLVHCSCGPIGTVCAHNDGLVHE